MKLNQPNGSSIEGYDPGVPVERSRSEPLYTIDPSVFDPIKPPEQIKLVEVFDLDGNSLGFHRLIDDKPREHWVGTKQVDEPKPYERYEDRFWLTPEQFREKYGVGTKG